MRLYSCSEHRPHSGPRCARSVEPVENPRGRRKSLWYLPSALTD
ncbi:hypothetical protein ACFOLD_00815 [Kocuria carniphila]